MLQSRITPKNQSKAPSKAEIVALLLLGLETLLVTAALAGPKVWGVLLGPNATLNGPFPASIAPLVSAALYLLPTIIGFLCRSWQRALLYATLPAWIGLGAFLIASTFRYGAFAIVAPDNVTANVSVLELFAVLGGIGWLGRFLFKLS